MTEAGEFEQNSIDLDTVTLSGTKILDVDIDQFDRSQMEVSPKGLDQRKIHIGFACQSDPVAFRSFRVKQTD
ncbi:MAG: hypothetical protein ACK56W_16890 [Pirellula sp.]|jgi:hypothetical protein|nr:DUF1080 domain-containing protein [Pirellula sp.]